ncbi:MAG: MinD/ParA family protein [Synechococcaceae cyanobacterium SM2_3_1]|nr:MinD/ParA family protein [Synechococcaceae cyanobacterium SM2_3_1]
MPPKIVSIHSYRGGTGKSNSTANLSALVASQRKRVGVVDTDIQSPGVHILFGLEDVSTGPTLNDYLWGKCGIEEAARDVTPPVIKKRGGSLFLVPSSIKAGDIARVLREGYDVGLLNDGFRTLVQKLKLDYLFIDTHPGLNEETLLSITISDILVLLLRPDRQDFQGTAVTIDVARRLDVPKMLLVVNKVLPAYDFNAVRKQVEQTYNAPVAGVLPLSEDLIRLASGGLFCVQHSDHPWSETMRKIAVQIMT